MKNWIRNATLSSILPLCSSCYDGYAEDVQKNQVEEISRIMMERWKRDVGSYVNCPKIEGDVVDARFVPICGEDERNYSNVFSACLGNQRFLYGKCSDEKNTKATIY
jgi:hypothetical protein